MAAWRFLRAYLWICLLIFRIFGYYELPQASQSSNRELLFAPRVFNEGSYSGFVQCLWMRNSHLRPDFHIQSRRSRSPTIPSYYWLLLLSGDIELNPGPVKFPCTICKNPVKKNQRGLCCDVCNLWTHARCCRVSNDQYNQLSLDCINDWLCPACVSDELPFANSSASCLSEELSFAEESLTTDTFRPSPLDISKTSSPLDSCTNKVVFCHLNAQCL